MDLVGLLVGLVDLQWTTFAHQQNILTCFRLMLLLG